MGVMLKKWKYHSFVSYNERETIADNGYAQLDELDLIQKRKQLDIRTKSVCDSYAIRLMLHTGSIYYGHTTVKLLGVFFYVRYRVFIRKIVG